MNYTLVLRKMLVDFMACMLKETVNYMPGTKYSHTAGKDVMKVSDKLIICSLGREICSSGVLIDIMSFVCPLGKSFHSPSAQRKDSCFKLVRNREKIHWVFLSDMSEVSLRGDLLSPNGLTLSMCLHSARKSPL